MQNSSEKLLTKIMQVIQTTNGGPQRGYLKIILHSEQSIRE